MTPEEKFAQEQARQAISQRYLARDDNPDLDPDRQDQLDRNRIPGELGTEQLAPLSAVKARSAAEERESRLAAFMPTSVSAAARDQPYLTMALAAAVGFALGAIW